MILGHGDARLVAALVDQASKLTVFPGRDFGSEIVERYAAELVKAAPPNLERAITYSSGSDAIDGAINDLRTDVTAVLVGLH